MELSELTTYAEEKYRIREQRKWIDLPGITVLCHPDTGKTIAMLMRQWSTDLGEFVECCDMRCGQESPGARPRSVRCFTRPFRMSAPDWIGVKFDSATDREEVLRLFDQAIQAEDRRSTGLLVLTSRLSDQQGLHRETPISFSRTGWQAPGVPEPIRKMLALYEYGDNSTEQRARNFYRQGKLMEAYEDDAPWTGDFTRFLPTYHDMNIRQLRGYFTWRTQLRKGNWQPTANSMAYIYVYELLNGIGTASPEESLDRMLEFERNYPDPQSHDVMVENLRRWMLEFAVVNNVSAEKALQCADQDLVRHDQALAVLHAPERHDDMEVFKSLCLLAVHTPTFSHSDHGVHLFAEIWRHALRHVRVKDKDLFTACFGEKMASPWHPLANVVYHSSLPDKDMDYSLNGFRSFHRRNGIWRQSGHAQLYFDTPLILAFLHQADLRIRRHLRTGHYLHEKKDETWLMPTIDAVLDEDRRRIEEAARPKIDIRLDALEHIRADAIRTRDSLLTGEEIEETPQFQPTVAPQLSVQSAAAPQLSVQSADAPESAAASSLPIEKRILLLLLKGESPASLMRANRLMPSVVADGINEAFLDEIGDSIVACDDESLTLVEDYIDDVRRLISLQIPQWETEI